MAADGSAFTCEEIEESSLPKCAECGCEDDNLWDDVCQECFENTEDTSWASMLREHGTN